MIDVGLPPPTGAQYFILSHAQRLVGNSKSFLYDQPLHLQVVILCLRSFFLRDLQTPSRFISTPVSLPHAPSPPKQNKQTALRCCHQQPGDSYFWLPFSSFRVRKGHAAIASSRGGERRWDVSESAQLNEQKSKSFQLIFLAVLWADVGTERTGAHVRETRRREKSSG